MVTVPALPETLPVIVCEKVFAPVKVFTSPRRVEDAAVIVIELPALKVVLLMVPREPERYVVASVEVATTLPCASVERSALPSPVKIKLLVVAVPFTVSPPVAVPLPMVVDAKAVKPPLKLRSVVVAFDGKRYEKLPVFRSVAQPNAPLLHVMYCPAGQPRPFAKRSEVEATDEVIAVVEAYGIVSAEFVGAENVTFPFA